MTVLLIGVRKGGLEQGLNILDSLAKVDSLHNNVKSTLRNRVYFRHLFLRVSDLQEDCLCSSPRLFPECNSFNTVWDIRAARDGVLRLFGMLLSAHFSQKQLKTGRLSAPSSLRTGLKQA